MTAPVANFIFLMNRYFRTGVQFQDRSTNIPTSWAWNFGDSSTSTEQNPYHTYANPGTYTVSLTATNANGSNTYSHSVVVQDTSAMTVFFDGVVINAYDVSKQAYNIETKKVKLLSGKMFVNISSVFSGFPLGFYCYAEKASRVSDLAAKIGVVGSLVYNGSTTTNCYISQLKDIYEVVYGSDTYTFYIEIDKADYYKTY